MIRRMAQQPEYFLYVGRNTAAAHYLHQVLGHVLGHALGADGLRGGALAAASSAGGADPATSAGLLDEVHPYTSGAQNGAAASAQILLGVFSNQKAALHFVQQQRARLVVVETTNEASSRKRFSEAMRQRAPGAPIVAVGDHAQAYAFPFDALIVTPLRNRDVARLTELLQAQAPQAVIRRGEITLDTVTREVVSPRGADKMTPKECALLTLLMLRANEWVDRAEIMRTIWETNFLEDTRTLDVHVRWVRQKIEPHPDQPRFLLTRRGVGYQFVATEDE